MDQADFEFIRQLTKETQDGKVSWRQSVAGGWSAQRDDVHIYLADFIDFLDLHQDRGRRTITTRSSRSQETSVFLGLRNAVKIFCYQKALHILDP